MSDKIWDDRYNFNTEVSLWTVYNKYKHNHIHIHLKVKIKIIIKNIVALEVSTDFAVNSFHWNYFQLKKQSLLKTVHNNAVVLISLNVIFQCCEHHKQNSIHLHCIGEEGDILEMEISKPGQIKPNLIWMNPLIRFFLKDLLPHDRIPDW